MQCGESVQEICCKINRMTTPPDLFPASEFDDWAETYDNSVSIDQFPFHGYRDVLAKIVSLARPHPGLSVLDLGTGTGNLALRFARAGCKLWCTDFSQPMLTKASQKLPEAHCFLHDLRFPLPPELAGPFDCIVFAYVFHHFELAEKIRILRGLLPHLAPGGSILIGDIAFQNNSALEQVKAEAGEEWEDEFYWLVDESVLVLESQGFTVLYEQVSSCAGVFKIGYDS
jgi:putative AdoMet-dependent methyltransferase